MIEKKKEKHSSGERRHTGRPPSSIPQPIKVNEGYVRPGRSSRTAQRDAPSPVPGVSWLPSTCWMSSHEKVVGGSCSASAAGRCCRPERSSLSPRFPARVLIRLSVSAAVRGPDLVGALANAIFQALIHVRKTLLSDAWSCLVAQRS
jgi:hypothetical protein